MEKWYTTRSGSCRSERVLNEVHRAVSQDQVFKSAGAELHNEDLLPTQWSITGKRPGRDTVCIENKLHSKLNPPTITIHIFSM